RFGPGRPCWSPAAPCTDVPRVSRPPSRHCARHALVTEADALKRTAAERALELVRDRMLVGLGTGTTASFFIAGLGRRVAEGLSVTGLASSERTAQFARASGIPLVQEIDRSLDLAVDGADEIDPQRNLLKGGGGALFREKL